MLLDYVLKPVASEYCKGELVKDTTDFLCHTTDLSNAGFFSDPNLNLVAMDICALYPNIKIDLALLAVLSYSIKEIDTIIKLISYSLHNSAVNFCGSWFLSVKGAPAGNPEIPSR